MPGKIYKFLVTPELYAGSCILGFLGNTMDPVARGKVETRDKEHQ